MLMKFIVEYHLKPGSKNKVVELFEQRGPNRNPGVKFQGAWIGQTADIAFVLTESEDLALVESVAKTWSEHGSYEIHPVIDVEQF
jgi:Protein of unknown function (DUF3303)